MKEYMDSRGWRYRVMQGLDGSWKARYRKPDAPGKKRPDDAGWHGVSALSWRKTAEEADQDLAAYANKKAMRIYEKDTP